MDLYHECGLFSVQYKVWASAPIWSYVSTEESCWAQTVSGAGGTCPPTSVPALTPLECLNVLSCSRATTSVSPYEFCLVVSNPGNASATVELHFEASYQPASDSGGDDFPTTLDIILISVGAGVGLIMFAALMVLVGWLCCKKPNAARVVPLMDDAGTFGPKAMPMHTGTSMGGHYLTGGGMPPMPMSMGGYPMGMGPHLMAGTMTILPPGAAVAGPVSTLGYPLGPAVPGRASALPPLPAAAYGVG